MFQGPGKEYHIPDVKPEDLTQNRLKDLQKEIEDVPPEQPQMPYDPIGLYTFFLYSIASKQEIRERAPGRLVAIHSGLWRLGVGTWSSSVGRRCGKNKYIYFLSLANAKVQNRHLIGGLFQPLPKLLQLIQDNLNESGVRFAIAKMSVRLIANLCFDNRECFWHLASLFSLHSWQVYRSRGSSSLD